MHDPPMFTACGYYPTACTQLQIHIATIGLQLYIDKNYRITLVYHVASSTCMQPLPEGN